MIGELQRPATEERVHIGAADRDLRHPRVQLFHGDPLGVEVDGGQPKRIGADAQIDVLGDEDGGIHRMRGADVDRHHQDQVVGDLALSQRPRNRTLRSGDAQAAAVRQHSPLGQSSPLIAQAIEDAGQLARVAAALGGLFLELVDLLQNEDRQDHFVVAKTEYCARVVNQNICVENEMFQERTHVDGA